MKHSFCVLYKNNININMILDNFKNNEITHIYKDCVRYFIGTGSSIFTFKLSKNNEEITIKINEEYITYFQDDYERGMIEIYFLTGDFKEYTCFEYCSEGAFLSDNFSKTKYKILSISIDNNGLLPLKCSDDEFDIIMEHRNNNAKNKLN